ncbi:histidinol-phosphate transaminase [Christensenellaceae bacterium OttesenSCG-928-M15]|nr:histidinol-phosphate transaminase [Christensenellaceae bacterium OttesenSCG-928-M15]
MSGITTRKGIMDMAPYIPGKPIEQVQREYGLKRVVKLASNENPIKTSPKALEAMKQELDKCYMYPEGSSPAIREALSKKYGVEPGEVLVANGGDHVISLICEAFVNVDDEVIVGVPSFMTYELATVIAGGKLVGVPLVDFTFDLDAVLKAITDQTKIIFLCNPNNPTGTIVRRQEVAAFMEKVPDHCIVVFDEAYFEYVDDPGYPDGMEYVRAKKNVIVIRTFSKIYGLAGVRIGYAVAPKHIMDAFARVLPAFPANRVAQAGALAALDDKAFIEEAKRVNDEGRAYFQAEFEKLGMTYAESHGNFIFVDTKRDAVKLNAELLKRGVIVRPGPQWGYPNALRVSIGTMEENKTLIEALKELV